MLITSLEERVNDMYEKILIMPDMHIPYEDYRAISKVYDYTKKFKPNEIILLGDMVDFYSLSNFDKSADRIDTLQDEIDVLHYHLGKIREFHKGKIVYLEGNHEFRLEKYLMKHHELSNLRRFGTVENLLELGKFDIDYRKTYMKHGVLFKHGNIVRKHSAYTAKGEMENEGTSGVTGHTHRISAHYKTDRSGQHAWYEMGHLTDEDKAAEYIRGIPNWQKGFGYVLFNKKTKTWKMEQIPIIKNSFMVDGETYKWRSNEKHEERELLG